MFIKVQFKNKVVSFPDGSDGKESICNAGDWGLIRGSGRSSEEGNGYPLQYSCLLQLLKPTCPRASAPQQEKQLQREARALQGIAPAYPN